MYQYRYNVTVKQYWKVVSHQPFVLSYLRCAFPLLLNAFKIKTCLLSTFSIHEPLFN